MANWGGIDKRKLYEMFSERLSAWKAKHGEKERGLLEKELERWANTYSGTNGKMSFQDSICSRLSRTFTRIEVSRKVPGGQMPNMEIPELLDIIFAENTASRLMSFLVFGDPDFQDGFIKLGKEKLEREEARLA